MRTLKKTLCLVLVLVMMVGLLAVGASAVTLDDYQDKGSIKHQEAVALLSALSVLQGDQGGFRPGDGLTRAEGAKIIAALLNANTTGLKSNFTDMDGHWADSFVAYCASIGIISGYGDGRFGPNDPLTYAQFAKMLLVALGYDATREELTGPSWEIGVAKLVNQVGLSRGIADFAYGSPITRDDAAQMAFITLTTTMVGYNGNGIAVAGGNLATPREELENATYDYRAEGVWVDEEDNVATDGLMQFIENYFPDYKLHVDEDDYGFTTHYWFKGTDRSDRTFKESKTVAKVIATRIMATYTTNVALVSLDTLYKDGGYDKTADYLYVIENGQVDQFGMGYVSDIQPNKGNTRPGVIGKYAGATVYLVDTIGSDGVADTLIVKWALLAKVTDITKAEDSLTKERQIDLAVYVPSEVDEEYTTVETKFETESFSKGEFVLVYPFDYFPEWEYDYYYTFEEDTDIIEITPVDSTIGTLGKVNLANGAVNALTVDGVRYSVAGADVAAMGPDIYVVGTTQYNKYGLNREITLYTSNGYVMGVNTTATPLADYVYVIAVGPGTTDLVTGVTSFTAAYAKQDGTTATIKTTSTGIEHKWCIMTPRGDAATFTAPAGLTQRVRITGLSSTQPNLGAYASNNKTNFVIRSGSGSGTTVKGYAGISAVPKFNDSAYAYVLVDDTKAAAAFVDYSGKAAADTAGNALFFLTDMPDGTVAEGPATYYTFNTMDAKGNVTQVSVASDATIGQGDNYDNIDWAYGLEGAGLYVPEANEKGIITKLTIPSSAAPSTYVLGSGENGKVSAGDGVISVQITESLGYGAFTVAPDATILRFDFLGNKKTVDGLEDLNGRNGTLALIAAPGPGKIATIFFMDN